jgi:hypothetical protein
MNGDAIADLVSERVMDIDELAGVNSMRLSDRINATTDNNEIIEAILDEIAYAFQAAKKGHEIERDTGRTVDVIMYDPDTRTYTYIFVDDQIERTIGQ